jgi:hypothetical protein
VRRGREQDRAGRSYGGSSRAAPPAAPLDLLTRELDAGSLLMVGRASSMPPASPCAETVRARACDLPARHSGPLPHPLRAAQRLVWTRYGHALHSPTGRSRKIGLSGPSDAVRPTGGLQKTYFLMTGVGLLVTLALPAALVAATLTFRR